ncbi:MAG: hypothetical protein B7Y56_09730 [Gallionellales bacterium 35-53-114]|jgi:transcriptional regulator with XRE-family HTH domain|nr:MAG: hypothetical protein B7Y56_09730 [Gallionellales bacterium 35-53-114]OYZ62897.1 MAG: hypothetical protein B7Y04_13585 [Gallionellales bacterium 24-53-125]OZB09974.1 MAG: hypothetical protein B7X61_05485 [Gallionellales bacterium 39-52-133]HQS58353.1 helix-turn-helix transcriptional regulator [Gallionellaceae bacterium]HQS73908.1 helix-turn-helix transcriptional regulator [Gallionellaceae bacterium]
MRPFAILLKSLRKMSGLRQSDLAEKLGYEQSYVSALELGLKGPPTDEFVNQLIGVLKLSSEDQKTLNEAVKASQGKFNIPTEAPTEVYWLFHRFRQQIDHLHPTQIELIEKILSLSINIGVTSKSSQLCINQRYQNNHETEAEM